LHGEGGEPHLLGTRGGQLLGCTQLAGGHGCLGGLLALHGAEGLLEGSGDVLAGLLAGGEHVFQAKGGDGFGVEFGRLPEGLRGASEGLGSGGLRLCCLLRRAA